MSDNVIRFDVRRGRLSKSEVIEIERLAARGLNSGQIAQRLNRLPGTIGFAMATRGLRSVRVAPIESVERRRGRGVVRLFTREEDAFIEALRIQGFTFQRIAEISGRRFGYRRTAATVCIRLRMIAARDESSCG